jgi:phage baseplate assembly protein W
MAKELFSDLNLAFTAHPVTGAVTRKVDRDAVRQSVKSLILTNFYERPFKPDIGCSIRNFLFELWTPAVRQQMENAVLEVIKNYEPRARVLRVAVFDQPDMNTLTVSVAFMVKNDSTPVVLDVILERVR